MAPFSWSRKNARQGNPDVAENFLLVGELFDIDVITPELLQRQLQPALEPEQKRTSVAQHSRSSTLTSTLSYYEPSNSEGSLDQTSRPVSQQVDIGLTGPSYDSKSNGNRGILSKSRGLLKRQGSKFSLLSSQSTQSSEQPVAEDVVPSLPSPERISRHGRKEHAAATRRKLVLIFARQYD